MRVGQWFKPRISIRIEKVIKFIKRNDIYSSKIFIYSSKILFLLLQPFLIYMHARTLVNVLMPRYLFIQ